MSNVLNGTKQQQVMALGRLGWSLRRGTNYAMRGPREITEGDESQFLMSPRGQLLVSPDKAPADRQRALPLARATLALTT